MNSLALRAGARSRAMPRRSLAASGITLVEMLVAMAITLLLMAAVVQVFDLLGTAVAGSRSTMEMSSRLRQARNLLQSDLSMISRAPTAWVTDDSGGYFEYVEGGTQDRDALVDAALSRFGDFDDVLMFTATSDERPFQGRAGNQMIDSPNAEIAWYAVPDVDVDGNPTRVTIYRRVLLVAPWADDLIPSLDFNLTLDEFQRKNDVSARWDSVASKIALNSMNDLRLRQNRFNHAAAFPHQIPYTTLGDFAIHNYVPFGAYDEIDPNYYSSHWDCRVREGEDIVLHAALAFDVRIFDPGAGIYSAGQGAFGPCDSGYNATNVTAPTMPAGYGAYVDLGYSYLSDARPALAPRSHFNRDRFDVFSKTGLTYFTYDTWPSDYESDGQGNDLATNGFDDDGNGIVDDFGERDTTPPFTATPTGIQVRLRAYEPDSRQFREVSVNHHFAQ